MTEPSAEIKKLRCPKCALVQPASPVCAKCGVVFAKLRAQSRPAASTPAAPPPPTAEQREPGPIENLLLYVPDDTNPIYLIGRALLLVVVVLYGAYVIFHPMDVRALRHLHLVNLPFHEAGHIIFSPFGRFIAVLGGSLMQLLVPLVCLIAFLFQTRDTFGASLGAWWLGQSMLDLAPYINDARDLRMTLLGGVTGRDVEDYHDWQYILRELHMLQLDHALAWATYITGTLLMLAACAWATVVLIRQYKHMH